MRAEERLTVEGRRKALARRMVQLAGYLKRCVCVDELEIVATDDGAVEVRATWPGGSYVKRHELEDLYRTCRTRRAIIGDILRARGVGSTPALDRAGNRG